MKGMKLFYGILIVFMIFTSCSTDQDEITSNDPITGEWKAVKETHYSFDFLLLEIKSDCFKQGRTTFNVNGSYNDTYFRGEQTIENCLEQYSVNNGQWELLPNGNYKISGDTTYSNSSTSEFNLEYAEAIFTNNDNYLTLKTEIKIFDTNGNLIDQLNIFWDYERI